MRHDLRRGSIHVARAEHVYPTIAPGSVSLVISDGPYNMRKAAWDRHASWDAFREWYRPHVEAWGRVCAPAATVYVWGTDDSASELRPLMRAEGWTKRVRVTWDKATPASLLGWRKASVWPDATEVCDFYTRGSPRLTLTEPMTNVWRYSMKALSLDRMRTGAKVRHRGTEGDVSEALHPCQKPLVFYDRMIRASSRVGDLVLEPFAGTCRAAVACEALPSDQGRRYVCVEPDEDGRDYLESVVASLAPPPLFSVPR